MWRFYKLTFVTIFAALLKAVPIGCKEAVLAKPLLKKHTINCLIFEKNTRQPFKDNMCLFDALALHLQGNQRLEEETFKIIDFFMSKWMDSALVSSREST